MSNAPRAARVREGGRPAESEQRELSSTGRVAGWLSPGFPARDPPWALPPLPAFVLAPAAPPLPDAPPRPDTAVPPEPVGSPLRLPPAPPVPLPASGVVALSAEASRDGTPPSAGGPPRTSASLLPSRQV